MSRAEERNQEPRKRRPRKAQGGAQRKQDNAKRDYRARRSSQERERRPEQNHDSGFEAEIICGRNAVKAALAAGRTINRLYYLDSGDSRLYKLVQAAREAGVPVSAAKNEQLDRLTGDLTHQGIIAEPAAKDYVDAESYLSELEAAGKDPFILILAEIQDGHNLGAILRVADAAAVDLVIIPERRSQGLDARVARASAGAIEFVPVARVTNLSRLTLDLKDRGYWIYGLDGEAKERYNEVSYRGKIALIVGNEARGINQKLREHCDFLLSIPMAGRINSLNASVACGIVTFAARAERETGLAKDEAELEQV
ncbi:MAG: 23S rRNA (guanosine(2251)-2'-O)-methyltransferase RlmB [Eubacteriales bacterium]|nr:23S rRNA (guanosine(2251)-2'-O)-methyltransferase RlmB [Eubacteriales bacterium]